MERIDFLVGLLPFTSFFFRLKEEIYSVSFCNIRDSIMH